jgi:hypothetical protein
MWVDVEGTLSDGAFVATEIVILDGELDEVGMETQVASVDLGQLSLVTDVGVRVVAESSTEIEGPKEQRNASFSFLGIGDHVELEGQLQKDGSILAEKIEIEESKRLHPDLAPRDEHELKSKIQSIDTEHRRIVLLGIAVQLSDNTVNKSPLLD